MTTGDPHLDSIQPGHVLDGAHGRYRIDAEHGRGGFGVTHRGIRIEDGQPVIVKTLHVRGLPDWKAVELFEREAAVLRGLAHPGIPRWLDDVALGTATARTGFALVMEMVPGTTLRAATRGAGLSDAAMSAWLIDMLGVLDFIHRRSPPLIHRDVNPKNIILRPDGHASLVDFGAVQAALRSPEALAATSTGTFGYAPLEQFLGQATPASDLYGLGMTYLASACGREPEDMPLEGIKIDVHQVLAGRDPAFIRIIEGLIEPDPRARIASARAALSLLKRHDHGSVASSAVPPGSVSAATDSNDVTRRRLAILAKVLARQGFTVETGGTRGRTSLAFSAHRAASHLADEDMHVYAAAAPSLEGGVAGAPIPPVPLALFVQSVVNEQAPSSGLLRRWLADRCIVVPVIVHDQGVGARSRAHLEHSLREPSHLTAITALVDATTSAIDLIKPRSLLGEDPDDRMDRVLRALQGTDA